MWKAIKEGSKGGYAIVTDNSAPVQMVIARTDGLSKATTIEIQAVNAALIAAAPDMLQMLQELSEWLVCPDCAPETIEHIKGRIDAAIKGAV